MAKPKFLIAATPDGCWEWQFTCTPEGYGRLWRDGKRQYVHRWVWERVHGPIPEGLEIDHLCNNTSCCNPDHLRVATHRENSTASHSSTIVRENLDKTHCPQGHPYEGANLYVSPDGARRCRTCKADQLKRWRAAQ